MNDIGPIAAYAYRHGITPLDFAEGLIIDLIEAHQLVSARRQADPGSHPGYTIDLTHSALASRILGDLLDAGWTMPDD